LGDIGNINFCYWLGLVENLGTTSNKIVVKINLENISQEVNEMSNNHMARYLAQEKEISVEEARDILRARRDFNYLSSDFLNLLKRRKIKDVNRKRII